MLIDKHPEQSELGKKTVYESVYNPDLLFPISRQLKRDGIGVSESSLPFFGVDIWNHYEVSWLNDKGKPVVAIVELIIGCESKHIIESKSMKLYFNSLNNTPFKSADAVQAIIEKDLRAHIGKGYFEVRIYPLHEMQETLIATRLPGIYLDDLDISCSVYHTDPGFLTTEGGLVEETVCSDLLKSNCLVTNQPDWCSVQIHYVGEQINHEGLLRYLVSFRNDNEFHEHCIEKIFMHLKTRCKPQQLTVYGRSTRRGGLDINSIRSTQALDLAALSNIRLCRQ